MIVIVPRKLGLNSRGWSNEFNRSRKLWYRDLRSGVFANGMGNTKKSDPWVALFCIGILL